MSQNADIELPPETNGITTTNRRVGDVLFEIWQKAPVSRAQLSDELGLSLPTISAAITILMQRGEVIDGKMAASTGGRKAQLVDICAEKGRVIGVSFTSRGICSAWSDMKGGLHNISHYSFVPSEGREKALETLYECIQDQMSASSVPVVRIGLGISGLLDNVAGISNAFPRFEAWNDVPLKPLIEDRFKIETIVDGHIAGITLAEMLSGKYKGFENALFIKLGPGLGVGIVIGGRLYRGSRRNVGEFGHTTLREEGGTLCYCGNYGCLECMAGDHAVVQQARSALAEGVQTRIVEFMIANGHGPNKLTVNEIFAAAEAGDRFALNLVERTARLLGTGIANLVNLFGPEMIILGGTMAEAGDVLLNPICQTLHTKALDRIEKNVQIRTGSFGEDEAVQGAVTLALHHYFSPVAR
jgi:predicted NBD/HSP70 family sugar kinase